MHHFFIGYSFFFQNVRCVITVTDNRYYPFIRRGLRDSFFVTIGAGNDSIPFLVTLGAGNDNIPFLVTTGASVDTESIPIRLLFGFYRS